jgi:ABC-type branched-subunit amino acid transport system substrate-binding protein
MTFRVTRVTLTLAVAAMLSFAGVVAIAPAAANAATNVPISIALVCTCSGPGGPEYQGVPGAFRARIDQQNAQGGVNGHKISTIVFDDQTNPTQASTAVQEAVSHGVLGIVSISALFFEGAKYAQQAGIPVTGSFQDGPEWGQQPYTNMFAADNGSVNPKYPVNTGIGKFLVSHGGNIVASYGYGISPSSTRSAIGTVQSVIHAGGKQGVLDTSVPFGGSDFTTAALVAKSKNVNGLYAGMDDNSNFALATAMKQAGVKLKAVVFPTGYEPAAITSPAWADLQGAYFGSLFRPFQLPNAATNTMKAALQKYDKFSKNQFPTFEEYEAWIGADLMIKGMQLSGKNPTSAGVIKSLRGITAYNGGGLMPNTINFTNDFGKDPAQTCEYYVQAQSKGFVPVSSQPICGKDIPGTTTVTGS